jgi:hypothetical protein
LEVAELHSEVAMKHLVAGILVFGVVQGLGVSAGAEEKKKGPSDAQVRQILIDESIAAYSGSCPCPYSTARNGSRCGKRSAYSREGGEAPLCYAKDVTDEMVRAYRERADE